jgi:uncharacterized protein YpmS
MHPTTKERNETMNTTQTLSSEMKEKLNELLELSASEFAAAHYCYQNIRIEENRKDLQAKQKFFDEIVELCEVNGISVD